MTGPAARTFSSRCWRVLRWAGLAAAAPALWACTSRSLESATISPTATLTSTVTQKINNNIDILFMVDNSSSMTSMQQKLAMQLPTFMQVLQGLPNGLPNVHIAVVSSDMGAPGDSTSSIGCTAQGNNGEFQYQPGAAASCTSTTLADGATFISDVDGQKNFTDPIESVFQCIAQLGAAGCGFEHQLASIDRALGADGAAPPASNANFLRSDAYLGIVLLTNEDDCSAPSNTTIFSLNGGQQSITNPDGPIANYRCNGGPRGGHYCKDPMGNMVVPPLNPPSFVSGTPPMENFTNCQDNETGSSALTPVSKFVQDIKSLKQDPDNQILVAAIAAPPDPYTVEWVPPATPPQGTSGQIWPQVMHSCGAAGGDDVNPHPAATTTDGSFGDPGVRISEFAQSFQNSVVASICDASYRSSMTAIATKLGALIKPNCITGTLAKDSSGEPVCSVTNHLTDGNGNKLDVSVPNCNENGGSAPCWTLNQDGTACPNGGVALKLMQDQASMNAAALNSTIECSLCLAGSTAPGCPCPNDGTKLEPNCN
jgi:hypothetical protein